MPASARRQCTKTFSRDTPAGVSGKARRHCGEHRRDLLGRVEIGDQQIDQHRVRVLRLLRCGMPGHRIVPGTEERPGGATCSSPTPVLSENSRVRASRTGPASIDVSSGSVRTWMKGMVVPPGSGSDGMRVVRREYDNPIPTARAGNLLCKDGCPDCLVRWCRAAIRVGPDEPVHHPEG